MISKTTGLYALALALYVPALLTNYFGVCPQYVFGGGAAQSCFLDLWDFYESSFVAIALLDFIPLSFVADRLSPGIYRVGFITTGAWMLIMAMPDVFLSYVPWALNIQTWQYWFNEYHAYWFGDASLGFLVLNLLCFLASSSRRTAVTRNVSPQG